MKSIVTNQKLFVFLEQNNALKTFEREVRKSATIRAIANNKNANIASILISCVDWPSTPEGYEFWRELHIKAEQEKIK